MEREDICRELFNLSDTDKDGIIWRRDLESVCRELDLGFTADAIIPNDHRGRVSQLQFQKYFSALPDSVIFNETSNSSYESLKRKDVVRSGEFRYTGVQELSSREEYEEKIVELHSVIAELSRKMDERTEDVIHEESEDAQSFTTDSFVDEGRDEDDREDEFEDYTSLAFERDLETNSKSYRRRQQEIKEQEKLKQEQERQMLEQERLELEQERLELEEKVRKQDQELLLVRQERDSYRRQVGDLMATCEYQEARMEGKEGKEGERNWDRRSLRRKNKDKVRKRAEDEIKNVGSREGCISPVATSSPLPPIHPALSGHLPGPPSILPGLPGPRAILSGLPAHLPEAEFASKCLEFEFEIEKINSHVEHLKSQNKVLNLALAESRSTCDGLTELLGKYESNNTALQLSLSYCDTMIESYDVLVALLETTDQGRSPGRSNRKKAETVARHLLSRAERNRPDSGFAVSQLDTTWDSSGYSQTTSSCSTSSSSMEQEQDMVEENRIREYISQLKVGRAGVQATVLELESVHGMLEPRDQELVKGGVQHTQEELEVAVLLQEICSIREERADIRAKLYLVSREKDGLELELEQEKEKQNILLTRIQIQKENQEFKGEFTDERESMLQDRVQNLLKTLEKVNKTSELRQKQSLGLIEDLKRANSLLTAALEQAKRKYYNKLRKLESKMSGQKTDTISSASLCSTKSTKS